MICTLVLDGRPREIHELLLAFIKGRQLYTTTLKSVKVCILHSKQNNTGWPLSSPHLIPWLFPDFSRCLRHTGDSIQMTWIKHDHYDVDWQDKFLFASLSVHHTHVICNNRTRAVRRCLFCDKRNHCSTPQAKHIFPDFFHFPWLFPDHCQISWLFQVFQVGGCPANWGSGLTWTYSKKVDCLNNNEKQHSTHSLINIQEKHTYMHVSANLLILIYAKEQNNITACYCVPGRSFGSKLDYRLCLCPKQPCDIYHIIPEKRMCHNHSRLHIQWKFIDFYWFLEKKLNQK